MNVIEQLGGNIFMRMTGARNMVNHDNGVSFKLSSRVTHDKINYVKVTEISKNIFNMEFGRMHRGVYTIKRNDKNVHDFMLQMIFTEATGLDTKLTGVPK